MRQGIGMPTYTYKCKSCEYQFDQRQSMSDDPMLNCPACGEPQLRKVINSAGIVFKGSGFYVTDTRNGAKEKKKKESGSKSKSSADTKTETKSESTSETKADSKSPEKAKAATE